MMKPGAIMLQSKEVNNSPKPDYLGRYPETKVYSITVRNYRYEIWHEPPKGYYVHVKGHTSDGAIKYFTTLGQAKDSIPSEKDLAKYAPGMNY